MFQERILQYHLVTLILVRFLPDSASRAAVHRLVRFVTLDAVFVLLVGIVR